MWSFTTFPPTRRVAGTRGEDGRVCLRNGRDAATGSAIGFESVIWSDCRTLSILVGATALGEECTGRGGRLPTAAPVSLAPGLSTG